MKKIIYDEQKIKKFFNPRRSDVFNLLVQNHSPDMVSAELGIRRDAVYQVSRETYKQLGTKFTGHIFLMMLYTNRLDSDSIKFIEDRLNKIYPNVKTRREYFWVEKNIEMPDMLTMGYTKQDIELEYKYAAGSIYPTIKKVKKQLNIYHTSQLALMAGYDDVLSNKAVRQVEKLILKIAS